MGAATWLVFLPLAGLWAQEPGITRQQADAILNELRQIRLLLERVVGPPETGAPARAVLRVPHEAWLGDKNAPLSMVEFTDYQCSFCRRFHMVTFPELRSKYIETGRLRFASRDLPLEFHSDAFRAAEAARCAGDQGQFWPMRDLLVSNAARLSEEDLLAYGQRLKLDVGALKACLESGKHRAAIRQDILEAVSLGVNGTPSFVIGRSTEQGVEGELLVGAQPLAVFEAKLKELGGP